MQYSYTGLKKPNRGDAVRIEDLNFNADKVTVSNKNLLLNPDFQVNQRGQSSYIGYRYGMDRWLIAIGETKILAPGRVSLSPSGAEFAALLQRVTREEIEQFAGKTLTLSLQKTDGTILSGTVTLPKVISSSSVQSYTAYAKDGIVLELTTAPNDSDCYLFKLVNWLNTSIDITRAKVELGNISTLANDPPANYEEQLALCQRYFWRYKANGSHHIFAMGEFVNNSEFVGMIDFGIEMRNRLTTTYHGNIMAITWDVGKGGKINSLYPISFSGKVGAFVANVGPNAPIGSSGVLRAWEDDSAYIDFDAEIY